jgi:phosphoserine phosphatase
MKRTGRPPYPVVVFDLDGTLLRGTSVSLRLGEWMGRREAIDELERRFRANEISNHEVADTSASWFTGVAPDDVWAELEAAPWIEGIEGTVRALVDAGCQVLLGTVTWRFAAEMLQHRYGFHAVCGTEMDLEDGRLSGRVSRYFDEFDKLRFVEEWCTEHGHALECVAAVGDSRSDVPLFQRVGMAIALNATEDARDAAHHVLDTERLSDVLGLLLGPRERFAGDA